ncbi:MAG: SpoIVB peptidase [Bacilli bacterium]
MFLNFFKKTLILFLLPLVIIPINVLAYSDYIVAGGSNIGIELNAKNIMVVGLYEINGKNSALDAGIKVGDIIVSVNNEDVNTIDEMVLKISDNLGSTVSLGIKQNGILKSIALPVYKEANIYKTGIYVKDSITGIGTLSFIDPTTKLFGALGHEITEKTTGKILEIKDGKIFDSTVTSINRSTTGTPGSKNADFNYDLKFGDVKSNTVKGIFGTYTNDINNSNLYKVAKSSDVKEGSAKILTVINGQNVLEYAININKIKPGNNEIKNILFSITDDKLLQATGGIVQGMSGSPIIQGDYIIGAVTHVIVDNPTHGYGIFITKMLEEAEK